MVSQNHGGKQEEKDSELVVASAGRGTGSGIGRHSVVKKAASSQPVISPSVAASLATAASSASHSRTMSQGNARPSGTTPEGCSYVPTPLISGVLLLHLPRHSKYKPRPLGIQDVNKRSIFCYNNRCCCCYLLLLWFYLLLFCLLLFYLLL